MLTSHRSSAIPVKTCLFLVLLCISPIAHAENKRVKLNNGGLIVDDKPFLPIFVWAQPSTTLAGQKALGMNTVHHGETEEKDPTVKFLDAAHQNGLLALIDHERYTPSIKDHPAVLAWTVEHEPEMPEDPPYQADLAATPGAVWVEGESPTKSTFAPNPWLDKPHGKLSGGKWLSAAVKGEGEAVYEIEIPADGAYSLWVREFNKTWANPTRWQIDDHEPLETPRTLKGEENTNLGGGRGACWAKYGSVQLTPGKHTMTLKVVPGRTSGDANKPTTSDAVWAIDAICLVPGDAKYPKARQLPFTPRRGPAVAKANYDKMKAADPNGLCWMVLTGFFHKSYNKIGLPIYNDYLQNCDIVSFDHYPITGWNQPGKLAEVGQMTRQLVGLAKRGQPVWSIIEASDQELTWTSPQTKGPIPQEMRAEAWMCIASGAKGVGYFTISFRRGKGFAWNNLTPEIEAELKRTNGELTELAGPIVMGDTASKILVNGDETPDKLVEGHAIMAIRKDYEGKSYVIAVNVTRQAVKPTITVENATAKFAEVWKEGRTIALQNGAIADTFEPLAVHVYVLGK